MEAKEARKRLKRTVGRRSRKAAAREGVFTGYSRDYRPLQGYAALVGIYTAGLGLALLAARKRRGRLPGSVPLQDVALMGVATHKLSRFLSKDRVMAPMRAPFVTFEQSDGAGEITENSRGQGIRKAFGDLVTCPYCLAVWVGTGLFSGFLFWPRLTRLMSSMFSSVAIADLLHQVHFGAKERRE